MLLKLGDKAQHSVRNINYIIALTVLLLCTFVLLHLPPIYLPRSPFPLAPPGRTPKCSSRSISNFHCSLNLPFQFQHWSFRCATIFTSVIFPFTLLMSLVFHPKNVSFSRHVWNVSHSMFGTKKIERAW